MSTTASKKSLPDIPGSSSYYTAGLVVLAGTFYGIIVASIATIVALSGVVLWLVGSVLVHRRDFGVNIMYVSAASAFGGAALLAMMMQGIRARVGDDLVALRCGRAEDGPIFRVAQEVAARVGARAVDTIYLVPGLQVCVREEGAIWRPPGTGRRALILGMALLDRITPDQLRAILAHEYGHFAARDTALSRFIGVAQSGFYELVLAIRTSGRGWQTLNPIYWVLNAYGQLFGRVSAKHGRMREFHADRYAVEAYGSGPLRDALIAVGVEAEFFSTYLLEDFVRYSRARLFPGNAYREISQSRLLAVADNGEGAFLDMLAVMLRREAGRFESHPGLSARLKMQGVSMVELHLPAAPRVAPSNGDRELAPEELAVYRSGPPSAAEELFGGRLQGVQVKLSRLMEEELRSQLSRQRAMRNLGL